MPFLAEKVTSMLFGIVKNCSPAELRDLDDKLPPDEVMSMVKAETEEAQEKIKVVG